jgi:hypothetical protein
MFTELTCLANDKQHCNDCDHVGSPARDSQPRCAKGILTASHAQSERAQYLLALSYFQLRQYVEAEQTLTPRDSNGKVAGAAAGMYLLG